MQIRHTLATHPYISRGPQRGQWGQLPRPDSDTRPKWREAGPACCAKTSFCAAFGCTLLRRASRRDWAVAAEAFFFLPPDQPPTNSSVFLLLGACPAPDCKPVVSAEAAVCVLLPGKRVEYPSPSRSQNRARYQTAIRPIRGLP